MSCIHLINVALVSGRSVKTEFKLLRSSCTLKEGDPRLREEMNVAQRARLEPDSHPEDCPFAASGDFAACRWRQN